MKLCSESATFVVRNIARKISEDISKNIARKDSKIVTSIMPMTQEYNCFPETMLALNVCNMSLWKVFQRKINLVISKFKETFCSLSLES